ncbi:hypothetical protein ONZ45_g19120 [Pleurotus djamor]|nr:hypothetical protein ONZ45_g19120 [Pleurotus djamor]
MLERGSKSVRTIVQGPLLTFLDDVVSMYASTDEDPVIPNSLYELRPSRYRSSKEAWKHVTERDTPRRPPPSLIRIVTWNVDFTEEDPQERLETVLEYLKCDIFHCEDHQAPQPTCILLQEVHVEAFGVILANDWVKNNFVITPSNTRKWPEGTYYGNITLISRNVPVAFAGILEFGCSAMQRTAVIVDVRLRTEEGSDVLVRVVNTHLESLQTGLIARPIQLNLVSKLLTEGKLHSGIVCGDMNAIGPEDKKLPQQNGLRDAWRKGDEDESGFTWGYQGRDVGKFPPARLDKVLFVPRRGLKVDQPERIGQGVQMPDGKFVSDHYGLITTIRALR